MNRQWPRLILLILVIALILPASIALAFPLQKRLPGLTAQEPSEQGTGNLIIDIIRLLIKGQQPNAPAFQRPEQPQQQPQPQPQQQPEEEGGPYLTPEAKRKDEIKIELDGLVKNCQRIRGPQSYDLDQCTLERISQAEEGPNVTITLNCPNGQVILKCKTEWGETVDQLEKELEKIKKKEAEDKKKMEKLAYQRQQEALERQKQKQLEEAAAKMRMTVEKYKEYLAQQEAERQKVSDLERRWQERLNRILTGQCDNQYNNNVQLCYNQNLSQDHCAKLASFKFGQNGWKNRPTDWEFFMQSCLTTRLGAGGRDEKKDFENCVAKAGQKKDTCVSG